MESIEYWNGQLTRAMHGPFKEYQEMLVKAIEDRGDDLDGLLAHTYEFAWAEWVVRLRRELRDKT